MDADMSEYVYMIREREFIRMKEHTYKIGKTRQEPNTRLTGYPKKSKVIIFVEVDNCTIVENKIKEKFTKLFTQKRAYGTERFNGDPNEMLTEFMNIVNEQSKIIKFNKNIVFANLPRITTSIDDPNKKADASIERATGEYVAELDIIQNFIDERLEQTNVGSIRIKECFEEFNRFLGENGEAPNIMSGRTFNDKLRKKGLELKVINGVTQLKHYKFKD
jgi:hypothetical protein